MGRICLPSWSLSNYGQLEFLRLVSSGIFFASKKGNSVSLIVIVYCYLTLTGIDTLFKHPTRIQAARAANVIHETLLFRRAIERADLEPIMVQGSVPLCSWQYERVFNTTRVPGIETDKIVHLEDSTHVAVYCHGKYFKLPLYHQGRLLRPCELEMLVLLLLDIDSSR